MKQPSQARVVTLSVGRGVVSAAAGAVVLLAVLVSQASATILPASAGGQLETASGGGTSGGSAEATQLAAGHDASLANTGKSTTPDLGLWPATEAVTNDPPLPKCPSPAASARSAAVRMDTVGGFPINSPLVSVQQSRTVNLIPIFCLKPDGRADRESCSGVLVSPELVLTAEHCTKRLGYEVPVVADRYAVFVGAAQAPAQDQPGVPRMSTGAECVGHTIWRGRAVESPTNALSQVPGDLALLALERCDNPGHLRELGGAPIDTEVSTTIQARPDVRYLGYPGDKTPPEADVPAGGDSAGYPQLWQLDVAAGLATDGGSQPFLQVKGAALARGASGGAFHVQRDYPNPGDWAVGAIFSFGVSQGWLDNWGVPWPWHEADSALITPEDCAGMVSTAVANGVWPPRCLTYAAQPPSTPVQVVAVPRDGQVTVSWTAPDWDGGTPIVGYTVTSSPGARTCSSGEGELSCTVTGLANGRAYAFTVMAINAQGPSEPSLPSASVIPRESPVLAVNGTVRKAEARGSQDYRVTGVKKGEWLSVSGYSSDPNTSWELFDDSDVSVGSDQTSFGSSMRIVLRAPSTGTYRLHIDSGSESKPYAYTIGARSVSSTAVRVGKPRVTVSTSYRGQVLLVGINGVVRGKSLHVFGTGPTRHSLWRLFNSTGDLVAEGGPDGSGRIRLDVGTPLRSGLYVLEMDQYQATPRSDYKIWARQGKR